MASFGQDSGMYDMVNNEACATCLEHSLSLTHSPEIAIINLVSKYTHVRQITTCYTAPHTMLSRLD